MDDYCVENVQMNHSIPSSLGAEAQAMSVPQGFVVWSVRRCVPEIKDGSFDLKGSSCGDAGATLSVRC